MRQATATRESAEDKISSLNQKLSNVSVSIYSDIILQVPFSTNNQLFIYLGGDRTWRTPFAFNWW